MIKPEYLDPNYKQPFYSLSLPTRTTSTVEERIGEIRHRMNIDIGACIGTISKNYLQKVIDINISKLYFSSKIDTPFIAIVTWGCADGSGDIAFAMKTVNAIHAHFPLASIYVVLRTDKESVRINQENRAYTFCDDKSSFEVIKQGDVEKVLSSKIENAPLIFTFDVATPMCDEDHIPSGLMGAGHYYHIDEYDGWRIVQQSESILKHSDEFVTHQALISGVSCCSTYRENKISRIIPYIGIHIDKKLRIPPFKDRNGSLVFRSKSLSQLQNVFLRSKLSCQNPEKAMDYLKNHHLYFAYNSDSDKNAGLVYLRRYLATVLLSTNNYEGDIDFVIIKGSISINTEKILDFLKNVTLSLNCCEDATFEIHASKPDSIFWETNKPSTKGIDEKRIRIFFLNKLSHDDMLAVMRASEPPTMVSGDQSFAELVSMQEKIPFYQLQNWKKAFALSLKSLCSIFFQYDSFISSHIYNTFREETYEEKDKNLLNLEIVKCLAKTLQDPRTLSEYRIFHQIIAKLYNINDWLIGEIKRRLYHIKKPDIEELEDEAIETIFIDEPLPLQYKHIAISLNNLARKIFHRKRRTQRRLPSAQRPSKRQKARKP